MLFMFTKGWNPKTAKISRDNERIIEVQWSENRQSSTQVDNSEDKLQHNVSKPNAFPVLPEE